MAPLVDPAYRCAATVQLGNATYHCDDPIWHDDTTHTHVYYVEGGDTAIVISWYHRKRPVILEAPDGVDGGSMYA